MGLMLFFLIFVVVRTHGTLQQESSAEDVKSILEKFIRQANRTAANDHGENLSIQESYFPIPIDADPEAGNDSNIYYFKTYMVPRIKFKSSSETLRLNKTARNLEVYQALSEGELIPGTSKNGFIDNGEKGHKRSTNGRNSFNDESIYKPLTSAELENNFNMLEELFPKSSKASANSPYSRIAQKPLRILHDYPEILIDHISYGKDQNDGKFPYQTREINEGVDNGPVNNEPESAVPQQRYPHSAHILNTIMQNDVPISVMHKNNNPNKNDDENKKQSALLEMILQRLPDRPPDPDVMSDDPHAGPYPVPLGSLPSRENNAIPLLPTYVPEIPSNMIVRNPVTTYMHAPILAHPQAPISPYLARALLGLRAQALRRQLLALQSIRPRYIYRQSVPVYYGLY